MNVLGETECCPTVLIFETARQTEICKRHRPKDFVTQKGKISPHLDIHRCQIYFRG